MLRMNVNARYKSLRTIAIACTVMAPWIATAHAEDSGPIKIGVIAPFTGSAAAYGAPAWQGTVLAAEQINAQGGLNGRQIELTQGDDACVPATGVTVAQRMINVDEVQILLGAVCSSVTLALMPLAEQNEVLLVNATSSNPKITYQAGVGGNIWTFRNLGSDETRARVTLEYAVKEKGRKKFGAIAVDNDFGRDAIKYVKKYMAEHPGVELVTEDYYALAETDFRPVLTNIQARGADGIIYFGVVGTTPILCTQMHELGMGADKSPLVGSVNVIPSTLEQCPETSLDGTVEAVSWLDSLDSADNQKFVAEYRARFNGETPDATAYDNWSTLFILRDAMKLAGSTDNRAVIKALEEGSFPSPLGDISFDDHHQSDIPMILLEVKGKERVQKGLFRAKITYE